MRSQRRWTQYSCIRCGVLAIVLCLAACSLTNPTPTPIPPRVATPGSALPSDPNLKIDSALLEIATIYQREGQQAAEAQARATGLLDKQNELHLTLILADTNTQPIVDKVTKNGGRVGTVSDNMVDIIIPLSVLSTAVNEQNTTLLQELAALNTVREIQITRRAQAEDLILPSTLSPTERQALSAARITEGVALTGADKWHDAGITGQGVKVGIIDIGFAGYETLLGTTLPQKVTFRSFASEEDDDEHGTAVAEIVHAMAPDAELFLCPFDSQAGFAQAVRYLTDEAKVQIIQMSFGWHDSRGDGTGYTQKQLDYARSKGVLPIKSAGNEGDSHYTALFNPNSTGQHQFAANKTRLKVSQEDGDILLYLIWDAWDTEKVDYNLYLEDERGTRVAKSENAQSAKTPYERIAYSGKAKTNYYVVIEAKGTQPAKRLDLFGKDTTVETIANGSTPATSISAPGDARSAFTVGATNVKDDKLEVYSSQGPTLDGRQKPDISAPTRVTTAIYKGRAFFGTSASTPHVSGAAALVFNAQPGATADQVQAFLVSAAKDVDLPGPESRTGAGRLAMGAVDTARTTANPAAGSGGAAFNDPLTSEQMGLPSTNEGRYTSAGYLLAPNANNHATWATYGTNYTDLTVAVTVTLAGASGAAGIIFWQRSADDYYLFAITPNGYYQVTHYQQGQWLTLHPWTKNTVISQQPINRLQLHIIGSQIDIGVNDLALASVKVPTSNNGRIGLLAAAFTQPGFSATFSDLTLAATP